jgi:hypothetical protein
MKSSYLNFLKKLIFFTIVIALIGYAIVYFLPAAFISPTLPFLFVFFFSVSLIVHYVLLKISLKRPTGFINLFMLLTFGKLIFFLTIILIYSFLNREDAVQFIIAFFILYLFFTAFEVVLSLAHVSKKKV